MEGISCICLAYSRPKELDESVESFLTQDYAGEKELIIFNDNPRVKYKFNHPEVVVCNLKKRFDNLGQKKNESLKHCHYPYTMPWPDDDIFLPHALSTCAKAMENKEYLSFSGYWYLDKKYNLTWRPDIAYGMIGAKTRTIQNAGGYPEISVGEDKGLRQRLIDLRTEKAEITLTPKDAFFIHQWSSHHICGFPSDKAWAITGKIGEQLPAGEYKINPRWDVNYIELVNAYVQ